MQKGITLKELEKVRSTLIKFEEIDFKIEEAGKRFLKSMIETNHKLQRTNTTSIGYNKVYQILKTKTKILKGQFVTDYSCFYNKNIVQSIVDELVGTEKLQKMSIRICAIRELHKEADSLKNKMREIIEENIDSEVEEELLDEIESLAIDSNVSIICVRKKIEQLEKILLSKEKAA